MLIGSSSVRVFVAADPVDFHFSFDRLAGLVRNTLRADPLLCGALQYVADDRLVLRFVLNPSMWRPSRPPHIFQTFSSNASTASVGSKRGPSPAPTPDRSRPRRIISTSASA